MGRAEKEGHTTSRPKEKKTFGPKEGDDDWKGKGGVDGCRWEREKTCCWLTCPRGCGEVPCEKEKKKKPP